MAREGRRWGGREDEVESTGVLRVGVGIQGDVDFPRDGTEWRGSGRWMERKDLGAGKFCQHVKNISGLDVLMPQLSLTSCLCDIRNLLNISNAISYKSRYQVSNGLSLYLSSQRVT